jgi:hypothetical protein
MHDCIADAPLVIRRATRGRDVSYQQIINSATEYLSAQDGTGKSSREIAEHLEQLMDAGRIERHSRNVVYTYLSKAANHDEASRIVSGGPHGGYSLEIAAEAPPEPEPPEDATVTEEPAFQLREKHLYPLIKTWLEASEYISADVSSLKAGGQWGNPDLLGVMRVEILGAAEIELVSVEAKLSEANWERFIFEAVSHKRFANRSWFCYRTATQYPPLPKNMAYYAERYKVGIIQIYLTDEEIERIANAPEESAAYLDRVQERVRALHEPVPLQEKRQFLSRAGIELNMNVARNA